MTLQQQQQVATRLIPVTKWPDNHPWPSVAGLRHLIFFANDNDFDAVVRRIGRRVLIDEAAFFEWVQAGNPVKRLRPTRNAKNKGA